MYFTFSFIRFKNNLRNKFDILIEFLETLFVFVVYLYIFQALYGNKTQVDGYTLKMVITSILFIICMSKSYANYEMLLQKKLKEGAFLIELMKPVDFKTKALFENIGNVLFNICFQSVPVMVIALLITEIMKPANVWCLLISVFSALIGYLIHWYLELIVNELSFFDVSVWGIAVMKNGIIDIFGGMLLPIWFFPAVVKQILYVTPIPYMYQIPVNIYLGMYSAEKLIGFLFIQLAWAALLFAISQVVWTKGIEKILQKGA